MTPVFLAAAVAGAAHRNHHSSHSNATRYVWPNADTPQCAYWPTGNPSTNYTILQVTCSISILFFIFTGFACHHLSWSLLHGSATSARRHVLRQFWFAVTAFLTVTGCPLAIATTFRLDSCFDDRNAVFSFLLALNTIGALVTFISFCHGVIGIVRYCRALRTRPAEERELDHMARLRRAEDRLAAEQERINPATIPTLRTRSTSSATISGPSRQRQQYDAYQAGSGLRVPIIPQARRWEDMPRASDIGAQDEFELDYPAPPPYAVTDQSK